VHTSTSELRQKLMTSDQILEMPANEIIRLVGSNRPIKLMAIFSHVHSDYKLMLIGIRHAKHNVLLSKRRQMKLFALI
jgi:type IV secretory pathway TraG/TraD family ATPase VirD4